MASVRARWARLRSLPSASAMAFSARPRSAAMASVRARWARLRSLPSASVSRLRRQRQRRASFATTRPTSANPGAASHAPQATPKIPAPVSAKPPRRDAEVGLASHLIANERMGRCLKARIRRFPRVEKRALLAGLCALAGASSVLRSTAIAVFACPGFGSLSASEERFASGVVFRCRPAAALSAWGSGASRKAIRLPQASGEASSQG